MGTAKLENTSEGTQGEALGRWRGENREGKAMRGIRGGEKAVRRDQGKGGRGRGVGERIAWQRCAESRREGRPSPKIMAVLMVRPLGSARDDEVGLDA